MFLSSLCTLMDNFEQYLGKYYIFHIPFLNFAIYKMCFCHFKTLNIQYFNVLRRSEYTYLAQCLFKNVVGVSVETVNVLT